MFEEKYAASIKNSKIWRQKSGKEQGQNFVKICSIFEYTKIYSPLLVPERKTDNPMSLLVGCLFSTSDQISLSCDGLAHSIHNWESSSYQPLIILPAIHDPVHIHRVVFNLIQNQIPILCIQLVILIGWHVVLKGGSARSFPQSGSASS